jgi:hypothetical protein
LQPHASPLSSIEALLDTYRERASGPAKRYVCVTGVLQVCVCVLPGEDQLTREEVCPILWPFKRCTIRAHADQREEREEREGREEREESEERAGLEKCKDST